MAGRSNRGHNRLMHDARREAERRRSAQPLNANPIDVLQEILDGTTADLRYAQSKVDELPEGEVFVETAANGRIPNEWVRLTIHYREELERIANNLVRNGIAERAVNVRAAQAALVVSAIQEVAVEIGVSHEQVRALGAGLRRRFEQSQTTRDTAADLSGLHMRAADPELPRGD